MNVDVVSELSSGEDHRAEAAVKAVAVYSNKEKQKVLIKLGKLMLSKSVDDRWWAVRTLGELDTPSACDLLILALNDEDPSVRQCAAVGLRENPNPKAIYPLLTALSDDNDLVVKMVSDALTAQGKSAVPALLEICENDHQGNMIGVIRALARIKDKRAIPVLMKALESDSVLIGYWANEGLDRMDVGTVFFKP